MQCAPAATGEVGHATPATGGAHQLAGCGRPPRALAPGRPHASRGGGLPAAGRAGAGAALRHPAPAQGACAALGGQGAACPVTPRLRYRLQRPVRYQQIGNLVCRCRNPLRGVRAAQTGRNPFVARVDTRRVCGAPRAYAITFIVVRQDDGWRVDDAFCACRPQTSIYNPLAGPCT